MLQPGQQLLKPGFWVPPASLLQGPSCFSGFQAWAVQLVLGLSGRTEGYLLPPCLPPNLLTVWTIEGGWGITSAEQTLEDLARSQDEGHTRWLWFRQGCVRAEGRGFQAKQAPQSRATPLGSPAPSQVWEFTGKKERQILVGKDSTVSFAGQEPQVK